MNNNLVAYEVFDGAYPFNTHIGVVFAIKGENQDTDALKEAIRMHGGHPVVAPAEFVMQ